MKAFIGRSFNSEDKDVNDQFKEMFNSLKKIGFDFWDAEEVQDEKISEKVKMRIEQSDFFIGILTKTKPYMPLSFWQRLFAKVEKYGTSSWVLQESGYALGLKQRIVLIVEDCVDVPLNDISGDSEKITFSRNDIQNSFNKVTQKILNVVEKIRKDRGEISLIIEPVRKQTLVTEGEMEGNSEKQKTNDEKNDIPESIVLYTKLDDEIEKKNVAESKRAVEKIKEYWNSKNDPMTDNQYERLYLWHTLRKLALLGETEAMDELRRGAKDGKLFYVTTYLETLKQLTSPEKALDSCVDYRDLFLDVEKVKWDLFESKLLIEVKKYIESRSLLLKTLKAASTSSVKHDVYLALSDVEKECGNEILALAYMELAIEEMPESHGDRFRLAYAYSDKGMDDLAVFHYEKLVMDSSQIGSMNNLGVCYSQLDLEFRKIKMYKKSSQKDNTLAASNLAYEFITSGFEEEAKKTLLEAREISGYNSQVDIQLTHLSKMLKLEEKKYGEIAKAGKEKKVFLTNLAKKIASTENKNMDIVCEIYDEKVKVKLTETSISGSVSTRFEKLNHYTYLNVWYKKEISIQGSRSGDYIDVTIDKYESLEVDPGIKGEIVVEKCLGYIEKDNLNLIVLGEKNASKLKKIRVLSES